MPGLLKRKANYDSDNEEDDDGYDKTKPYNYELDDDDENKVAMFEAQRSRASAPKSKEEQRPDSELIMGLLACGETGKAKKKMLLAIQRVVRLNLFQFKKFIDEETSRNIVAECVLAQLNFKDIDEEAKKSWIDTCDTFVVKHFNKARGHAQTGVRKVMCNYWCTNGKVVLDKKWYPLNLKR